MSVTHMFCCIEVYLFIVHFQRYRWRFNELILLSISNLKTLWSEIVIYNTSRFLKLVEIVLRPLHGQFYKCFMYIWKEHVLFNCYRNVVYMPVRSNLLLYCLYLYILKKSWSAYFWAYVKTSTVTICFVLYILRLFY